MASTPSGLPSIQEPLVAPDNNVMTRTWYRVIAALTKQSGSLTQPIVVKPNSFFVSGDLNSGGTLDPATIPNDTVLGNSSGAAADATPQSIDPSLSLADGILSVKKLAPQSLFGNAGTVTAAPGQITVGAGLTLQFLGASWVLNVIPNGPAGPDLSGAQTLSWWRQ